MSTYFIHNSDGTLIGWVEAVDRKSAEEIAKVAHEEQITISAKPDGEWYARHETVPEIASVAFAA